LNNSDSLSIFGRNNELHEILKFSIYASIDSDNFIYLPNIPVQTTQLKIIVISGPYGVGKSFLLSAVSQQLGALPLYALGNRQGFEIFSSHPNKNDLLSPFLVWRSIILDILVENPRTISKLRSIKQRRTMFGISNLFNLHNNMATNNREDNENNVNEQIDWNLLSHLPPYLNIYLPLLNGLIFEQNIIPQNSTVDKLFGNEKMDATINLLVEIIDLYIKASPKTVVFIL
jgi:hypothetical protein